MVTRWLDLRVVCQVTEGQQRSRQAAWYFRFRVFAHTRCDSRHIALLPFHDIDARAKASVISCSESEPPFSTAIQSICVHTRQS